MLIRNFFRDILSTLPRLMSVIIVTALGVLLFVGMGEYNFNMENMAKSYYDTQNVADYWVNGIQFTKSDERKISKLDSVESTQSEINVQTEIYQDENINIDLQGISGDFIIDKPYIISGRMFESNKECMLDASYAKAHNIHIDDKIDLRIKNEDRKLSFIVCALIDSPEYISNVGDTDAIPNSLKHGFAYVKEDALKERKELIGYNTITLKLKDNTSENQFKNDVEKILGTKLIRLLSFDDNEKAHIIITMLNSSKAMTSLMPMIFFLISAFIMFTTMTRVVENGRMMIGTLKAFGYGKIVILTYFCSYALIVVVLGNIIGILPSKLLAKGMVGITSSMMTLPDFPLEIDVLSIIKSVILTTVICVGTAAAVCISEIKHSPTECMRPKSPKIGKANIFEKIKFLWSNMNFVQKTITRNIFRNKTRLFMCVIGVAGCMAIILTGFGFHDSITTSTNNLFANMYKYDANVILQYGATSDEAERIKKLIGVDRAESVMNQPIKISKHEKSENTIVSIMEDKVFLMVPSVEVQESMTMPRDGTIISSTLAKKMNIKNGDILDILVAGEPDSIKVKVSEIRDSIFGCYLSKSLWRKLGQEYKPSNVYVKTKDVKSFMESTKKYDFINIVKLRSEMEVAVNNQTRTVISITVVFIIFGGVLGLVVLYNLGILNYYERMRELATLKVLGFIPKEIRVLVLRENTIFTIIGIIIGIPLGIILTTFMISATQQKDMTIVRNIKINSYIYSAGLSFIFSLIVNKFLSKKLEKIDMLGSLKSVE
ncbi:ABC transporter permease [Clostridium sp.]|uniref:ABC transporter permease n=1 Tax=Clostridium sp. TaxID=1506 RepID=UPI0025C58BBD|nr:ABC transporter permease [Clostridium sp.]